MYLVINTMESLEEKHFTYKCNELLRFYSKESLIDAMNDSQKFDYLFTSMILSNDDINYALLKKYYIGFYKESHKNLALRHYIQTLDFESANKELTRNISLRKDLFEIYLDNLNVSCADLTFKNYNKINHDVMNQTLTEMNSYYRNLRFSVKETPTVLKKSMY